MACDSYHGRTGGCNRKGPRKDDRGRRISVWILGAEYGTSVATILHRAVTRAVPITQARSGGVVVIVDAQVRVWGPESPQRPWAPGGADQAHRPVPLGGDELLRVFWGTDLTRLSCPYRQAMTLCTKELDPLAGEDKRWIMGHGIAERLGWPLPRN